MKSLVTGGAGFIGSHVARQLIERGHQVLILDDLSGGVEESMPRSARFVKGSILDVGLVESLFEQHKFDYVYHLAAYAAENLSHFIKRFNYQNNLIGSVNLINAAVNHGVKCFVFTSSIAVYGNFTPPFREDMGCTPVDSYGIAKLAVESELRISREMFGLDYIIFRAHNIFGEGQSIGDRYRNVVGIFMNQCLKGEPMTIYGDGEQQRAFSYIEDVAPIIAKSVDIPAMRNEVFNIGGEVPATVNELAAIIAEEMGLFHKVVHLPQRREVRIAFCTHGKLNALVPTHYPTLLRDGLARMAFWVQRHGAKESQPFKDIEIRKNLPESWK